MAPQPRLRVHTLGVPQVWVGDAALDVTRWQRPLTLLAYLAAEPDRAHPREALAALFWPDSPASDGLRNLRQLLHRLRRAIGDEGMAEPYVWAEAQTLQFNVGSDAYVDIITFRRLVASVAVHNHRRLAACPFCAADLTEVAAIYRGRFLAGWDLADGAELESWMLLTQEALAGAAHTALHALGERHLVHGDAEAAMSFAQRLLAFDPWDEAAERLLLRAFTATGRRSRALREAARFRELLQSELQLPLEDETEALVVAIRDATLEGGSSAPSGAPLPTAPLVGRAREVMVLERALAEHDHRLLTLLGPGGSGKTRLALHVAEQQAPDWRDGLAFVPLAEVAPADGLDAIAHAVLAALGVAGARGSSAEAALLSYLRTRETLVILDNFEHLLPDGALLIRRLLRHAPAAKFLVTSQARLNLPAEWIVPVEGLALPPLAAGHPPVPAGVPTKSPALDRDPSVAAGVPTEPPAADGDPAVAAGVSTEPPAVSAAVALFAHHARRVNPRWALTAANAPYVARICRLVDGLPLALELAAAWIRTASACTIADRLARNLDLLRSATPHGPARHQSLIATFDYAHGLLSPADRALFRRLAIFQGPFLFEAAEQIAGATLPSLARLLDRSLIRLSETDRWDLHPLLRRAAAARLADDPEADRLHDRHATYYLGELVARSDALWGRTPQPALNALGADWEDVRAAWRRHAAASIETEDASEMAAASRSLGRYLDLSGQFRRGVEAFEAAAAARQEGEAREPDPIGALMMAYAAHFLMRSADYDAALALASQALAAACDDTPVAAGVPAEPLATEAAALAFLVRGTVHRHRSAVEQARHALDAALTLARQGRLPHIEAEALRTLGAVHWRASAYEVAIARYHEALAIDRALGDPRGEGWTLNGLGLIAENQGQYDKAIPRYRDALALLTDIGDLWGQSIVSGNLGYIYARVGDAEAARAHYRRDLAICRSLGDRRGESWTQGYLSLLAHQEGRHQVALRHALSALELARAIDHPPLIARALTHAGHAWAGLSAWDRAEGAYQEALALRRTSGEWALALETQAGLIRVALGRGDSERALTLAEEILAALGAEGADRTDEHLRIYLACHQALAAAGDPRAPNLIRKAHTLLTTYAARIADPTLRTAYLDRVAAHREIQDRYARL